MTTLDEFKANLIGGGARVNQFRVTFNTLNAIATGLDTRKASFLIKAELRCQGTRQSVKLQFHLEVETSISLETENLKLGKLQLSMILTLM